MKTILSLLLSILLCAPEVHAQAVAIPMPFVKATFLDSNGAPCNGCLIWSYSAGTTSVLSTYTTSIGNVANTNPVVLNASGQADIFLGTNSYKLVLEAAPIPPNAHGAVIWTEDNIPGSTSSSLTEYTAPYANSVARTINSKLADTVSALDFGVDNTGVTDASTDLNNAVASGHPVYLPCGTYFTSQPVVLSSPAQGLIGESESCVIWNYVGTANPITWQMNPYTTTPAGVVANITLNGTSTAQSGILTGHLVGGTFANLSINGFTGSPGNALDVFNQGVGGGNFTWNTMQNVQTGVQAFNNHGIVFRSDDSASSFDFNNLLFVGMRLSTGQTGISLLGGVLNHSKLYVTCDMSSSVAGTVAPICIDSASSWVENSTTLLGSYLAGGPGTGTPYAVQVESASTFSNNDGVIALIKSDGTQLGVNNIAGASGSPTVTMHAPARPDWDTGTFTLGSLGALNLWTGFRDTGPGSCGLLEGSNANSILCTINNGSGNQFIVGSVIPGNPLGTASPLFSVDVAGSTVAAGNVTAGNGLIGVSAAISGQTHTGTLLVDGLATINNGIAVSGPASIAGTASIDGVISQGLQSGGNDDNDGQLAFVSSQTSATFTMTYGGAKEPICVTSLDGSQNAYTYPNLALVTGHWQITIKTQSVGVTANGNYHCRIPKP